MPAPGNLSFELPADEPGLPEGWALTSQDSVAEIAAFDAAVYAGLPAEWLGITAGQVGIAVGPVLAPGGFFVFTFSVDPTFNESGYGVDVDLVFFGPNDRFFYDHVAKRFVLRIGGADLTSAAVTWTAHATLTLTIRHTLAGRSVTVVGTTSGGGTVTAGAAAAIDVPRRAYVMGADDLVPQGFTLLTASVGLDLVDVETFEHRWTNFFYDRAIASSSAALFTTADVLVTHSFDGFEEAWEPSGAYALSLPSAEEAAFDQDFVPFSVERFEDHWGQDPFERELGSSEAAAFVEGGVDAFDAVPGWDPNYTFSPSELAAVFAGADNFEGFESVRGPVPATVTPTPSNKINAVGHPFQNDDVVLFASDGAPPLGLTLGRPFVVKSRTANDFEVSQVSGGPTIAIQDYGTGALKLLGDPVLFWPEG